MYGWLVIYSGGRALCCWGFFQMYGAAEIDARCQCLPPNHSAQLFTKGISSLTHVTGQEHSDMACILLGLIVDIPLPEGYSPICLICAVQAILNFLYLAQYPLHSSESLDVLEDALCHFHNNKAIFVDLGIWKGWEIPKLHWLDHYQDAIECLGTTDNFNTKYTEHLHINMAKDAYEATNGKDIYLQMTCWLKRKEKVLRHERYTEWWEKGCPALSTLNMIDTGPLMLLKMTKLPSTKAVPMNVLAESYSAVDFQQALAEYVVTHCDPGISRAKLAH